MTLAPDARPQSPPPAPIADWVIPGPHLFIAGAPRCGTTTLFDNLSGHPGIVPACTKEPAFLIPREFPMKGFRHLWYEQGPGAFEKLFEDRDGVRMEASATYLYAPGVAHRIASHFPEGRVVLILREPMQRLISEYRYALLMRVLPHTMSFSEYLQLQRKQTGHNCWREPHLRALDNGRYHRFVREYIDALGKARVMVIWTEELHNNPQQTMQRLAKFAGIAAGHYDNFTPRSSNTSLAIRRPRLYGLYFRIASWRSRRLAAGKRGRLTHLVRRRVANPLLRASTKKPAPLRMSDEERAFLQHYYRDEPRKLAELIEQRPPW